MKPITMPHDSAERKRVPVYSGLMAYFPDALIAVAKLSQEGNEKHNHGQPLHWSREKSADHADCIARHLLEHGTTDGPRGQRHSTMLAWRALALLQLELEAAHAQAVDEAISATLGQDRARRRISPSFDAPLGNPEE